MPMYEYACRSCEHSFEMLVRSDTVPACPACQSQDLERLLSVFATASATASHQAALADGPCGSCGHPDGPGACHMH
jgi:putative FmdB family regulatory protein